MKYEGLSFLHVVYADIEVMKPARVLVGIMFDTSKLAHVELNCEFIGVVNCLCVILHRSPCLCLAIWGKKSVFVPYLAKESVLCLAI